MHIYYAILIQGGWGQGGGVSGGLHEVKGLGRFGVGGVRSVVCRGSRGWGVVVGLKLPSKS